MVIDPQPMFHRKQDKDDQKSSFGHDLAFA